MEGLPWTAERSGRTADGELQSPLPTVRAALPVVVPVTRLVGKLPFLGIALVHAKDDGSA